MFKKNILAFVVVLLSVVSASNASAYWWEDEAGGVFNIPSVTFNPTYWGYGSNGYDSGNGIRYNKVDLQVNSNNDETNTMYIINNTKLYTHDGVQIATSKTAAKAWKSAVGWNHVDEERDGGLIAGGINDIEISGTTHTMVYLWSVNSSIGKTSGWAKLSDLSPSGDIEDILVKNKKDRDAILTASGAYGTSLYTEHKVVEAYLSNAMSDYYVTEGRDDENGAGRAEYYYTNEDTQNIGAMMNIPETNRQRYGVAHDLLSLGSLFYEATYVDSYDVALYPSGSGTSNQKMTLVFGYSETNTGEKIYSWVNEAALSATGNSVGGNNVVHITKRNSTGYAIDGRSNAADYQSSYLWTANQNNANQQWIETDRGNGYYSYQKMNTNYCLSVGSGSVVQKGDVFLIECRDTWQSQQWNKVATSNGAYQLRNRRDEGFAINGGGGGANRQNVNIYDSSNSSWNLQWFITNID